MQESQPTTTVPARQDRPAAMRAFTIIWLGQLISLLGTGMTRFALTIWAWQVTGEATALALVGFFTFAPLMLVSAPAGALVDRWNRKFLMIASDLGAGLATVILLALYVTGNLQIWHLYIAGAIAGVSEAFQFPAFSSAISTMLPKSQYARANGMLSLAESAAGIAAPVLAGILLAIIGIGGVMAIDIVTFICAVSALAFVSVPQPARSEAGNEGTGNLWQESLYGFRYIWARPSLLGLQLTFLATNLTGTIAAILTAPMILARTANHEITLATVQSFMGVGGVTGGLILSAWGGPKHRIHGVLLGFVGMALLGVIPMGIGQTLPIWGVGAFFTAFFLPFVNGSNQAIWQAKVAPDVQGRVFAARRLLAQLTVPLAMLAAGPLADHLFEPAMQPGRPLAASFGWLVGTGLGAGMGLLMVIMGVIGVFTGLAGYAIPLVRNAEQLLPDHEDALTTPVTTAQSS